MEDKKIHTIQQISLLSIIPGLKEYVTNSGRINYFEPGDALIQEGSKVHQLLIPLEGSVRMSQRQSDGSERHIGFVVKGRSLNLRSVLSGEEAKFTYYADEPISVLAIPSKVFLDTLAKSPVVENYLRMMVESSAARSLKKRFESDGVDSDTIMNFFLRFAESKVVVAGEEFDFLKPQIYLIDAGEVELIPLTDAHERAVLAEGAYFGGQAVIPPHHYTFRAVALKDCRVRSAVVDDYVELAHAPNLIEALVSETWIQARSEDNFDADGTISALPGEVLTPGQIQSLEIGIDLESLRWVRSDNGAFTASLINLCRFRGLKINESNLGVDLSISKAKTPLAAANALEAYGLVVTYIATSFRELKNQILPTVVALNSRSVVLLRVTKTAALIADPCRGFVAVSRPEFEEAWDGHILEIEPALLKEIEDYTPTDDGFLGSVVKALGVKESSEGFKRLRGPLISVIKRFKAIYISNVALTIFLVILGVIAPKVVQYSMDDVLRIKETNLIVIVVSALFILAMASLSVSIIKSFMGIHFGQKLNFQLSQFFYRHFHRLRQVDHGRRDFGDVEMTLKSLESLKDFIIATPIRILQAVIEIVVYTILLMTYDFRLAAIAFVMFPITYLVRLAFRSPFRDNFLKQLDINARTSSLLVEQISGISAVKAASAEDSMRRKYENVNLEGVRNRYQSMYLGMASSTIMQVSTALCLAAILFVGCSLAFEGKISLGEVLAVNMYARSLFGPLTSMGNLFESIESAKVNANRVAKFFATPTEGSSVDSSSRQSVRISGKVKLERASFRYTPDGPMVLDEIDLTIYPGQVLAIVGKSGCGKTTLANLIAGRMSPTFGKIYLDDIDSGTITESSKRMQISVILQDNELFAGTIAENIAYSDDVPDQGEIARSAVLSSSSDFIKSMPNQFNTHLAEGGMGLSGGQKQRVSIARALYRDTKILVMDEATSALDAESEAKVSFNLRESLENKTAIVIAHRLSTIKNADRIIVMDEGRIVEDGTHTSLVDRNGYYASLYATQSMSA